MIYGKENEVDREDDAHNRKLRGTGRCVPNNWPTALVTGFFGTSRKRSYSQEKFYTNRPKIYLYHRQINPTSSGASLMPM